MTKNPETVNQEDQPKGAVKKTEDPMRVKGEGRGVEVQIENAAIKGGGAEAARGPGLLRDLKQTQRTNEE